MGVRWFIACHTDQENGRPQFENHVVSVHPFEWLRTRNKNWPDQNTVLLFYKEIEKDKLCDALCEAVGGADDY